MSMMSIDENDTQNANEPKDNDKNLAPQQWKWGDSSNDETPSINSKQNMNTDTNSTSKYPNMPDDNNINETNATDNPTNNSNSGNPWIFSTDNDTNKDNNNTSNTFTFGASTNNNNDISNSTSSSTSPSTGCNLNNNLTFGVSTVNNNNNTVSPFVFGASTTTTTNNNTNAMSFDTSINDNNDNNETKSADKSNDNDNENANDTSNDVSIFISSENNSENNNGNQINVIDNNNNNNDNANDNTETLDSNDVSFGISSHNNNENNKKPSEEINTNNNSTGWTFTPTNNTNNNNENENKNDNTNTVTQCTFGTPNTEITDTNNITNITNNTNNTNNNTGWTFGTPSTDIPDTNNNNKSDTNTNTNGWAFATPNDNNNSVSVSTNNNDTTINTTGWSFGTQNTDSNTATVATSTDPFNTSFQTIASDIDPFSSFRSKQQQSNDNPPPSNTRTTPITTDTTTNNATPMTTDTTIPPSNNAMSMSTIPCTPIINATDIDHEAQAAFWAKYQADNANTWECQSCSVRNDQNKNICEACDVPRGTVVATDGNVNDVSSKQEVEDAMDMDEKKEDNNEDKNLFKYYDILSKNNEILQYNNEEHPMPKYFPYIHNDKRDELKQEGQTAWNQFDDNDSNDGDNDDEEDVEVKDNNDVMDEKVKTYLEYKKRRMNCKLQMDAINKKKRIRENDVLIAMCGDGSVGGQLGVGNGSVTKVHNNISPFPFIMENLLKTKNIRMATTGIMSTAIVTTNNEIYVWGLNDKSELTVNPRNICEVDVGDDDDELSNDIAWNRLYNYYYQKIEQIYKKYNGNKLIENKDFIKNLLNKRKVGKITLKYKGKQDTKEGRLDVQDTIDKIVKQFEDKCKMEDKKSNKKYRATYTQEINIEEAANGIQAVYIKICDKFDIPEEDRSELYIPKASEDEIRDRRDRKLNPYKYLKQSNMDIDNNNSNNKCKPALVSTDSENVPTRHMLLRSEVKINNEIETDSEYEYEQKSDSRSEDDFQGTLSCSYWTPACIRLPYKMVVKQITLGGTHMVVLDDLGQVWSSGTFMSDGPIGHHYDMDTKEIIRYQRTLHKISNIQSQDDGLSSSRIGKNKQLPEISEIASGANHFLMLDVHGTIWKMGVTKLGQRWCSRNTKKYLCPQRISVINVAQNKRATKRIKFLHIACGNHHNLAISTDQQLYSWGQNIWLQCGHPKSQCGYGNVVDQPRLVLFYKNKININNKTEKDILLDKYPKIQSVCAGEHMTIALDIKGKVYTCGRNACGQLGRPTRSEGIKDYGTVKVQTEVKPDFMRQVSDLNHILIDWIGCGSVFWYAHNKFNGSVYGYGDSSNGRVGIGSWKYSRGRPVFDMHNFDLKKFQIQSASGGSDHCVFVIKKIPKLKHRHSIGSNYSNTNNSRENSLEQIDDTTSVTNQMENLQTVNSTNNNSNNKMIPASHAPIRRKSRKRKLSTFQPCIPEEEEMNVDMNEPTNKRRKKTVNSSNNKPVLTRDITSAKTTPSPGPPSKGQKMT